MLKACKEGLQGGGYVDSFEQKGIKGGRFEVIVGKSVTARGKAKCFDPVNSYYTEPKRRMFEALKFHEMWARR